VPCAGESGLWSFVVPPGKFFLIFVATFLGRVYLFRTPQLASLLFFPVMFGLEYRNAIEEELEVLYDAYYEELEQYANYQQRYVSSGGTIPPPPGPGPFPGSVELDKNGAVVGHPKPAQPPARPKHPVTANGRKHTKQAESEFDDDEGDEDEYEDDEEYEEDEEEEEEEEDEDIADGEDEEDVKAPRGRRPPVAPAQRSRVNGAKPNGREGLFNLGTSLTVTGKSFHMLSSLFSYCQCCRSR
jgi:hypothetical protein